MEENKYIKTDAISLEEEELINALSHLECMDDGIYPTLNYSIDEDSTNDE